MKELRISFRWILRWIDERGTRPYHRFKSNIKVMWPVYPRVGEFLQGNLFSFIGEHSSITQEFDGGPDKIVATDSHKMELTTTELQELEEWVVTKVTHDFVEGEVVVLVEPRCKYLRWDR